MRNANSVGRSTMFRRSETLRTKAHATAKWGNLRLAEAGWRGRQPGGNRGGLFRTSVSSNCRC